MRNMFFHQRIKRKTAEKPNKTDLVLILDRSGSMHGLERDTIGGYNSMLDKQRDGEGTVRVTTVLFDTDYEMLHNRQDIRTVEPMTDRQYQVRGCTALLDAIGRTIDRMVRAQRHSRPEDRADKVLFVIITDGMENSSHRYTMQQIRRMIEREKNEFGWEFLFLGANIDAIATASQFGIDADRAVNYHADSRGTALNYEAVSKAITHIRCNAAPMSAAWKVEIDEDFRSRESDRR